VHIQGCALYFMLVQDQTWIPPLDFGTISSDAFDQDKGFMFHYFKMMYHSTLLYSMVDISVRTEGQLLIMSLLLIIVATIAAIIFG